MTTTKYIVPIALSCAILLCGTAESVLSQDAAAVSKADLPFPKKFDATKYLGKWYEIARLPSPSQPGELLATAEYSVGKNAGDIIVKNTAYDAKGKEVQTVTGRAKLLSGDPPRMAVSFGPVTSKEANYYVMHVSKNYDVAVVGTPSRKSLWILARKPTLGKKRVARLVQMANKVGFATDKLIVSDWKSAGHTQKPKFNAKRLLGTWKYVSGEKNGADLEGKHFKDQRVEITKEAIKLKSPDFEFVLSYEFMDKTEPQAVKLTITKSPFGAGQATNGILELKKDMLKLCYPPMGGDMPTKFAGPEGSGLHYFVLKRAPTKLSVEKMIGVWTYASGETEGGKVGEDRLSGSKVEITKDTLTLKSDEASFVMEYKLDTTQEPAALNLKIVEGPFGEGSSAAGIADLKNGKLFICYDPRGGDAPTKFDADAGHLFVLSRDEKE